MLPKIAGMKIGNASSRVEPALPIRPMPRSPIELPPEVARRFVRDMRAYFAAPDSLKRDEIAARKLHAFRVHQQASAGTLCRGAQSAKIRNSSRPSFHEPAKHGEGRQAAQQEDRRRWQWGCGNARADALR